VISHNSMRRCLGPNDRVVAESCEPPLGAHVVSPRRCYTHHGIYVGSGRVAQYGGLSRGLRRGPIEEVALAQFTQGQPLWVRASGGMRYSSTEVVRRARSRLGEDHYSLLTNNCEHFCEWCVGGEPRSYQVDDRISEWRGIMLKLMALLVRGGRCATRASAFAEWGPHTWRPESIRGSGDDWIRPPFLS
jgi:hypothetical protein